MYVTLETRAEITMVVKFPINRFSDTKSAFFLGILAAIGEILLHCQRAHSAEIRWNA